MRSNLSGVMLLILFLPLTSALKVQNAQDPLIALFNNPGNVDPIELEKTGSLYDEQCGNRRNYKCWRKGGHSLDKKKGNSASVGVSAENAPVEASTPSPSPPSPSPPPSSPSPPSGGGGGGGAGRGGWGGGHFGGYNPQGPYDPYYNSWSSSTTHYNSWSSSTSSSTTSGSTTAQPDGSTTAQPDGINHTDETDVLPNSEETPEATCQTRERDDFKQYCEAYAKDPSATSSKNCKKDCEDFLFFYGSTTAQPDGSTTAQPDGINHTDEIDVLPNSEETSEATCQTRERDDFKLYCEAYAKEPSFTMSKTCKKDCEGRGFSYGPIVQKYFCYLDKNCFASTDGKSEGVADWKSAKKESANLCSDKNCFTPDGEVITYIVVDPAVADPAAADPAAGGTVQAPVVHDVPAGGGGGEDLDQALAEAAAQINQAQADLEALDTPNTGDSTPNTGGASNLPKTSVPLRKYSKSDGVCLNKDGKEPEGLFIKAFENPAGVVTREYCERACTTWSWKQKCVAYQWFYSLRQCSLYTASPLMLVLSKLKEQAPDTNEWYFDRKWGQPPVTSSRMDNYGNECYRLITED